MVDELLLHRRTTSTVVADVLRDEIRRGLLRPGSRLRQEEVASRLGVSTTPVREAFQALQGQGLLTLDPHRGVVVFRPTAKDVRETYEIREALESLAIEKAIANMTDQTLDDLQSLLDEMVQTEADQPWIDLNARFHRALYDVAGSARLSEIIGNLASGTSTYMHIVVHHARRSGRGDAEHQQILDACKAKDVVAAQRAVRGHLEHTVEQTLRLLDHPPIDSSID